MTPFLATYLKCTDQNVRGSKENKRGGRFSFSCKHVSWVIREDAILGLAQIHGHSYHHRDLKHRDKCKQAQQ